MENKIFAGERVKAARETKGLSLEILAEKSGVETDMLRKIEESKSLPSIAPLVKVARALGVRLGTFIDDHDEKGPSVMTHDQVQIGLSLGVACSKRRDMQYFSLSQSKTGRHMESFEIDFNPSTDSDFVLSSHEGEEFLYVLEGAVEINYGDDTFQLKTGDSIYYDSIVSHHVHCASDDTAKILAVIYTPV